MTTTENTTDQGRDVARQFSEIEMRDQLDQLDEIAVCLSGHLLDASPDEVAAKLDVNDLRVQVLRLVWAASQARELSKASMWRARQLAMQVADHEGCDK